MSTRFLIATLFLIIAIIGGIMTGNGTGWTEGIMMIGGFAGAIGSLVGLNSPKWNKKLWTW